MDSDTIREELSAVSGDVASVRHQPPHYVLTLEHGALDEPETLLQIAQNPNPDHSHVVDDLPGWASFEFSNAIEVFVTVDEALANHALEE